MIKEFHLFAGIGGGIYGGKLLGHQCIASVEIDSYCNEVLAQRQKDGWMEKFPQYEDLCALDGKPFEGSFDVLCGGFPCQAFSTAAHGKNIEAKNLWGEMLRFTMESNAPIVFGENVVLRAIETAKKDLEALGYRVARCRLSCADIGADHQRNRFWLLAVKDDSVFEKIAKHVGSLPKLVGDFWAQSPTNAGIEGRVKNRREQLKGVGNAQSPWAAATAFRILVNRHINGNIDKKEQVSPEELEAVFVKKSTWISNNFDIEGFVHTPTTMANYSAPSMMKHQGCRNFKKVFDQPTPLNAEYLMGFPIGASSPLSVEFENIEKWSKQNEH